MSTQEFICLNEKDEQMYKEMMDTGVVALKGCYYYRNGDVQYKICYMCFYDLDTNTIIKIFDENVVYNYLNPKGQWYYVYDSKGSGNIDWDYVGSKDKNSIYRFNVYGNTSNPEEQMIKFTYDPANNTYIRTYIFTAMKNTLISYFNNKYPSIAGLKGNFDFPIIIPLNYSSGPESYSVRRL